MDSLPLKFLTVFLQCTLCSILEFSGLELTGGESQGIVTIF